MRDLVMCDICGKVIESIYDLRVMKIASAKVGFYEFHIHTQCIVNGSMLETAHRLIENELERSNKEVGDK